MVKANGSLIQFSIPFLQRQAVSQTQVEAFIHRTLGARHERRGQFAQRARQVNGGGGGLARHDVGDDAEALRWYELSAEQDATLWGYLEMAAMSMQNR